MDSGLLLIVAMFVLMWVLLIRPQKKRQQEQKSMLASLAPGDEVLTVGGLFGIVQELEDDDTLVVEIADRIHVRVSRRAVASVTKPDAADDEPEDEPADEDEEAEVEAEDAVLENDAR